MMFKRTLRSRRLVGVLTVICAAVASSLALGGTAAAVTPTCTASGLDVWLDTQGNGAAGTIFYTLEFTNLSGHTCTLSGYPGVSAVNLAGHQLGSAARRNPSQPVHTVTLASATPQNASANTTATVVLGIVEAGNFSPSACHAVTAAGLRVYPPGQTASRAIAFPFSACTRSGPVYLNVSAAK